MKSVSKAIECGSNSNGYYRKSPDGTLECWIKKEVSMNIDLPTGSSFYKNIASLSFPHEFKTLLYINAGMHVSDSNASYYGSLGTTTKATGTLYFVRPTIAEVNGTVYICAVGRWK